MMASGSELYEAMKSSMKASPISNSSLRDRRFSRRVIVGWEARSIPSGADRPSGTHLQDSVAAQPVAVVGILKAGHYLVYPLAEHLRLAVYHHRLPARIFDAGFDAFDDAVR